MSLGSYFEDVALREIESTEVVEGIGVCTTFAFGEDTEVHNT